MAKIVKKKRKEPECINGEYQCKHIKENVIASDCPWCIASVANKGLTEMKKQRDVLLEERRKAVEELPSEIINDHTCTFDCKGCVGSGWNQMREIAKVILAKKIGEIAVLKNSNEQLKSWINNHPEIKALKERVEELEETLSILENEDEKTQLIGSLRDQIAKLQGRIKKLEKFLSPFKDL